MNSENGTKKIKEIKEKLIAKKQYLILQLKKFAKKNTKKGRGFKAEFPKIGDHQDENAMEVSEYENTLSVERDFEKELKNVGNALKKTSEGTYGKCSGCGKSINPKRLEIMPEAILCIECGEIRQ